MSKLIRSWLYCPGHQIDIVRKAADSRADAIVIDLEDAVPVGAKRLARANLAAALAAPGRTERWIRVNPLNSPWGLHDLRVIADVGAAGVRIAKCESVDDVKQVADIVGMPLGLIIETALGLERAFELAAAHPLVAGISLGEADLKANLRVASDEGLSWARGRIVSAARAAGLPSPAQSVYTHVTDLDGLQRTTESARATGFFGRSVIHPRQVDIVNMAFTPTTEEVAAAQHTIRLLAQANTDDRAALVDEAGMFVDPAVVEGADFIVRLHEQLQRETFEMENK